MGEQADGRGADGEAAKYVRRNLERAVSHLPEMEARQFAAMVDCALVERSLGWREVDKQGDRAERAERERDGWRDLARELMDDPNEKGCPPVSDGWIHRPHQPASDNTYCERCGESWPCPNERARAALFGDESGGES